MERRKRFLILSSIFSLLCFSGCALFLVGGGVAGGIAISRDTMEGHFDKPLDRVWSAAREVVMQEGFIRLEDKPHATIDGEIRKSQINIQIIQVSEKTVRIRVKARKGYKLLPDMDLANQLHNMIFQKLK